MQETAVPSRRIVSQELAELLKLLAHPGRVRLIEELRAAERDVTSVALALELPSTCVAQHHAALRAHRLMRERCEGRSYFYSLTRPAIASWILEALDFLDIPSPLGHGAHIKHARELWTPETRTPPPAKGLIRCPNLP
jgi:DNA-binding transcriptional ArsR family regulator